MNKKRKTLVIALGIVSVVLLTTGITFALFRYAKNGDSENTIKSGNITFLYDEQNREGNGISIEDALPMSDTDGKAQTNSFNFKILSNTAPSISLPYEITLRQKAGTDNIGNAVKVYLAKTTGYTAPVNTEQEVIVSKFSELDDETNNGYAEKILHVDQVPLGSSNYEQNYRLKMWLDDSVDYNSGDYAGKHFTVTVNVYSKSNLSFRANDITYAPKTNPETNTPYTTCSDMQCAIDDLYTIYGN